MTLYYENNNNVTAATPISMIAGDQLYIRGGVFVGASGAGADGVTATDTARVQIYGTLLSVDGDAFHATNGENRFIVGSTGAITGFDHGIFVGGFTGDNRIVNDGTITGDSAIALFGAANSVTNTGHISGGDAGITMEAGSIVNSGTISAGAGAAIISTGNIGSIVSVDNSGTIATAIGHIVISADHTAFAVTNSGHITGNMAFGEADDSYDGALGTITGAIDGNAGDDILITGAGKDRLTGGLGSDALEGGARGDTFVYTEALESSGNDYDTIVDLDAKIDRFDLVGVSVTGIDADVTAGQLRAGHFVKDLKNAIGAAQLDANHAVVFTPDSGDLAGRTYLVIDANATAGFQNNADYVIDITDATHLDHLSVGTFI